MAASFTYMSGMISISLVWLISVGSVCAGQVGFRQVGQTEHVPYCEQQQESRLGLTLDSVQFATFSSYDNEDHINISIYIWQRDGQLSGKYSLPVAGAQGMHFASAPTASYVLKDSFNTTNSSAPKYQIAHAYCSEESCTVKKQITFDSLGHWPGTTAATQVFPVNDDFVRASILIDSASNVYLDIGIVFNGSETKISRTVVNANLSRPYGLKLHGVVRSDFNACFVLQAIDSAGGSRSVYISGWINASDPAPLFDWGFSLSELDPSCLSPTYYDSIVDSFGTAYVLFRCDMSDPLYFVILPLNSSMLFQDTLLIPVEIESFDQHVLRLGLLNDRPMVYWADFDEEITLYATPVLPELQLTQGQVPICTNIHADHELVRIGWSNFFIAWLDGFGSIAYCLQCGNRTAQSTFVASPMTGDSTYDLVLGIAENQCAVAVMLLGQSSRTLFLAPTVAADLASGQDVCFPLPAVQVLVALLLTLVRWVDVR